MPNRHSFQTSWYLVILSILTIIFRRKLEAGNLFRKLLRLQKAAPLTAGSTQLNSTLTSLCK